MWSPTQWTSVGLCVHSPAHRPPARLYVHSPLRSMMTLHISLHTCRSTPRPIGSRRPRRRHHLLFLATGSKEWGLSDKSQNQSRISARLESVKSVHARKKACANLCFARSRKGFRIDAQMKNRGYRQNRSAECLDPRAFL